MDFDQGEINKDSGKKREYLLPLSIVIAAVLISGSWIYTSGLKNKNQQNQEQQQVQKEESGSAPKNGEPSSEETSGGINVKPASPTDHIRGSIDAPIKIIEFSDLECPFCKTFHRTMEQVMANYSEKVAWIYRNYPLESLHPVNGLRAAEASECAAELGGNDKFWLYIDKYFEITPSNDQIDPSLIVKIGGDVGLSESQLINCVSSGKYNQLIENNLKDGTDAGLRGTPYSVLIAKDGKKYPINGAQPYSDIKSLIDQVLQ